MTVWRPDVLGDGFECTDINLGTDEEGTLVATLVRALPTRLPLLRTLLGTPRLFEDVEVLYVHGWNDYFFQRRLARFFTERGARFFALDLRKYGRSLRKGQTQCFVQNLADYDEEIARAIDIMHEEPGSSRKLVLLGHSTGGLVLSLWANRHRGVADALVLNSPWLDLQLGSTVRAALKPVVNLQAKLKPQQIVLPQLDLGFYMRAQHEMADPTDLEVVNLDWRPKQAIPVLSGWLSAIVDGHTEIQQGIEVGAPVCTLLSARSLFGLNWSDEMLHSDTVLEVEGIAKAALKLGKSVTVERIDGALHDIFVSEPAVRDEAYRRLDAWLRGWQASRT